MSEKVGHTPGPWTLAPRAKATIRSKDGRLICDVHWVNREANVRLIAAAPDLLAVLKDAERILSYFADGETSFSGSGTPKTARDAARAAIANAEGRDNG